MSSPETYAFPPALHPALQQALTERGYQSLTPVQHAVLQKEAEGRDLLVSARTGSGKTVAFGVAIADALIAFDGTLPGPTLPLALVVAPTRELALQVQRELQWLYKGAVVASCVGGMDPRAERRTLERGAHIVVGTPGRLRDHLERGNLLLSDIAAVILDEADEMLDLGFREELEAILDAAPTERRTLLFSATLPKPIVELASTYQKNALRLTLGGNDKGGHADIDYRVISVAPGEVEGAVVNVLRFFDPDGAIIFCGTREAVKRLTANLIERGFGVSALSGELSQNERTRALQDLRDRRSRICVATDVAARGLDIPDLDLVIHADLPTNRETLQHRSGRTGRAGRKGVAVMMTTFTKKRRLDQMLRQAGINASWGAAPSADEIRAKDEDRLVSAVPVIADAPEEDQVLARKLLADRSAEDIAAAYVALARSRLPQPEELSEGGSSARPDAGREVREPRAERERRDRGGPLEPEAPRAGFEDAQWFSLGIGRNKNAEARWVLPLICRRGHVTRSDIGAIRIFERETRFQIKASALELFERASAKGDADGGRIEKLESNAEPPKRDRTQSSKSYRQSADATDTGFAPALHDGERTFEKPKKDKAPWKKDKPAFDGPREERPYNKPRFDAPGGGYDKPRDKPAYVKSDKPYGDKPFKGKPVGDKPFTGKPKAGKPYLGKKDKFKG